MKEHWQAMFLTLIHSSEAVVPNIAMLDQVPFGARNMLRIYCTLNETIFPLNTFSPKCLLLGISTG
jgi:predicted glycosyltransferase